jgi:hypothetical protein
MCYEWREIYIYIYIYIYICGTQKTENQIEGDLDTAGKISIIRLQAHSVFFSFIKHSLLSVMVNHHHHHHLHPSPLSEPQLHVVVGLPIGYLCLTHKSYSTLNN